MNNSNTVDCGRCGGEGIESYDEDGRQITDTCYHCAGTGKLDAEAAFQDRLMVAASILASRKVAAHIKACNESEEGEDFALHAAENGMSTYDYRMGLESDHMYSFAEELSKLSDTLQKAIVDELCPEVEEPKTVSTIPAPVLEPMLNGVSTDEMSGNEIPF